MKVPSHLAADTERRWLSCREAQAHFGRSQKTISNWIVNGTCVEFGLRVYRDPMGFYWIGIPAADVIGTVSTVSTASLP